jgi:type I restriction enzyme R subunit
VKRNEKQTREQLIDPKLRQAGWEILTRKGAVEPGKACIEIQVTGLPKTAAHPTGVGYVDYVLFGDDCKPLALVEAKKSVVNEEQGKVQAELYADALERQYGVRPIIYYTNGWDIKIIDGMYPARQLGQNFHRKDELEWLLQKQSKTLASKNADATICGRYYQQDAIAEVLDHLEHKHSRSLIVLATGTGKTRTACGLADIFIRNNYVKRILFLADRKNLVTQAKEDTFDKFLPNVSSAMIIEGKVIGYADARIVFSTYQSMLSMVKDLDECPFGIGHFDLIIVDEAHRSLFNKYADIFGYFDALMIGLTATPRNDIHKSTYKVFNLDSDMPNYEYDLVKAVKDGYLVYFRALDRTPDILKDGVTYAELNEEDREQYEELFTEEDGSLPEKVEGDKFRSIITNEDTIRKVLQNLMDEGLRVNHGDALGKTIIFARDHHHAVKINDIFHQMYPNLCSSTGINGVDYCVIIDNQIRDNDHLQREFKAKQDIRIVISVDMMDTGVDIPEVCNLVFFKKVASKIKFWQMIGRGTRLCPNLNVVAPSEAYFTRKTNDATRQLYKDKNGFMIFDVCGVFKFFGENPDGQITDSDVLSPVQKIFLEKVALYMAMQRQYASLDAADRTFYPQLRDELIDIVKNINMNTIRAQKNQKYIEKYADLSGWTTFMHKDYINIKKYVAPCVELQADIRCAQFFDFMMYRFSAAKLCQEKDRFTSTAKALKEVALYLTRDKGHISEVKTHQSTLDIMMQGAFIEASVSEVEAIRIEIRELMRFIDPVTIDPIISDFDDHIDVTAGDADTNNVDFTITLEDLQTYPEKVKFYLEKHKDEGLIAKIINLDVYTQDDVDALKSELQSFAKDTEYDDMFAGDDELVAHVRRSFKMNPLAVRAFLAECQADGYTEEQLEYVKMLLDFIALNGSFSRMDIVKNPRLRAGGLFAAAQLQDLLTKIEKLVKIA